VRGHGRAGPGRADDWTVSGEGSDEGARDAARGSAMTRVERRLSAADLLQGKVDLVAGLFEQRLGVGDDLREEKIPQASGEELNATLSDTGPLPAGLTRSNG